MVFIRTLIMKSLFNECLMIEILFFSKCENIFQEQVVEYKFISSAVAEIERNCMDCNSTAPPCFHTFHLILVFWFDLIYVHYGTIQDGHGGETIIHSVLLFSLKLLVQVTSQRDHALPSLSKSMKGHFRVLFDRKPENSISNSVIPKHQQFQIRVKMKMFMAGHQCVARAFRSEYEQEIEYEYDFQISNHIQQIRRLLRQDWCDKQLSKPRKLHKFEKSYSYSISFS